MPVPATDVSILCLRQWIGRRLFSVHDSEKDTRWSSRCNLPSEEYCELRLHRAARKAIPSPEREMKFNNDPSAGSPTETLLRLLLPLNDQVWSSSQILHMQMHT